MLKFLDNWILALALVALVCAGCGQSSSQIGKDATQMTIAELKPEADKGNPVAQFEMGRRFADGHGVLKNLSEAVEWWQKAAGKGYPPAEYSLGFAYGRGHGVPKDQQQALRWWRASAEGGFPIAQEFMGIVYAQRQSVLMQGSLTQDYTQAFKWFQKAAAQESVRAQYYLALCYRDGKGTETNLTESFFWLQRAASNGVANAQDDLGEHYSKAGLPQLAQITNKLTQMTNYAAPEVGDFCFTNQNFRQAANWYSQAANQNYCYSQGRLGAAFMLGMGVQKDPVEAYKWLTLATTNEHSLGSVFDYMKTNGMVFTPEQVSAGKLRADEFFKTNHISPNIVVEIHGL